MSVILEIKDLEYSYPDKRQALFGININIEEGESVGIVGANGAGKSTLLMHLVGVLLPEKGEINICGNKVSKKTLPFIRKKVGMVFQDSDDQLFMTRVYDDVAFGPRNYKLPEDEVDNRVKASLEKVGILHLADRAPYKLSGGEKRSAAIASVLAMNPEILVMDEPTTALDPKSRRRLIKLLTELNQTKIIASHDLDMIFELCKRTIILNNGKVVADGLTKKLLSNEELMESCGLELPLSLQYRAVKLGDS